MVLRIDKYTKLTELFAWVQEPDSLNERVERLQSLAQTAPEFVKFVIDYFNQEHTFDEVLAYAPFVIHTVHPMDSHGYSVPALPFIKNELHLFADAGTMRTRIKHSKLLLAFDEMPREDAEIILSYMRGELKLEKINLLVLSRAFPEIFQLGEE
ncbi:hypothetical protein [Ralstonia phage RSP15]|uniref:hypothetical protein n=1 Tax=Ralstonia phage RSP15 TaxID=1785960 RepID=UPI00074D2B87|nr:hypothetical protein BH754_gp065 [Ralstonia phage RSP15]BAU40023.1 hypothetical protein [Ralstonia phage RSP15]